MFRIAQIVKSKNIQYPEASIQYQQALAMVFVATAYIKCNILCNYRVNIPARPGFFFSREAMTAFIRAC
jgi:hypothetical protein